MDCRLQGSMKERDWIHRKARKSNSSRHWNTYRKLRNKVNCLVKSAKTKYNCDLFQDAKRNAKKVWNAVNEVCYRNCTSERVQSIISDGIQHTTPKSIASAMNSFFASIGRRLADKITTTWLSCNSSTDLPKCQFQLAELEESFSGVLRSGSIKACVKRKGGCSIFYSIQDNEMKRSQGLTLDKRNQVDKKLSPISHVTVNDIKFPYFPLG